MYVMVPQEHLPLPVALSDWQRDEGMMMGVGLPYLRSKLLERNMPSAVERKEASTKMRLNVNSEGC